VAWEATRTDEVMAIHTFTLGVGEAIHWTGEMVAGLGLDRRRTTLACVFAQSFSIDPEPLASRRARAKV